MKAIEIACRVCEKQPGEMCDFHGTVCIYPSPWFHAERLEDAASAGIGEPVSEHEQEQVDAAIYRIAESRLY